MSNKHSKEELVKKKQLAFTLYVDNRLDQKLISEVTGITEKSISQWKKKDKDAGIDWEEERRTALLGPEKQMRRTIRMYDLLVTSIEEREPPANIPNTKEADILSKLSATINALKSDVTLFVKYEVGKEAIAFVQKKYRKQPEKIIEFLNMWQEYMMNK